MLSGRAVAAAGRIIEAVTRVTDVGRVFSSFPCGEDIRGIGIFSLSLSEMMRTGDW